MVGLIGDTLPPALGIALSPFPLIPAILLLLTKRAWVTSGAFLAGWFAGVAVATVLFVELTSLVKRAEEPPTWASWGRVVLGILLILLAVRQWRKRATRSDPAWIRAVESATWSWALRLGFVLSAANPKILLLVAAAGMHIGAAELTFWGTVGAVALFTVIASSTVALPSLLRALAGKRILGPLGTARDWLKIHNAAVVALVIALIGVLLLSKGIRGL
ncbi:GAP family protein [Streptomyces sp. NPDC006879]|uniref:GAP family protein n=1 Tax=Streptomyces sp. NPDC006879 TaxID=3364767 RepID=UPI0036BDDF6D